MGKCVKNKGKIEKEVINTINTTPTLPIITLNVTTLNMPIKRKKCQTE